LDQQNKVWNFELVRRGSKYLALVCGKLLVVLRAFTNRNYAVHFVTPNTDGDEEELDAVQEDETGRFQGTAVKKSGESSSSQQQQQAEIHQQHYDINVDDASLPAEYTNVPYPNTSIPGLDETSELPSITDVLNSHISPTYTAQRSDHNSIAQLRRNASASEVLAGGSIAGWHASPTSNPRSSPHITKKSPLDSFHSISPFANSTFSPNSSLNLRWPVSNAYEASLLHHYVVYCTNWIDVCDSRRHFEKEVPKRAAHFPVILHGILGLAARHLWLMGKTGEDHSQGYVDQCLQALIVALEDPLAHWDENFLVAVILLRLHEEMGDADEQCHHFGKSS
jgi:hypothetical protein